jgi:hypothetical protein
VIDGVGIVLVVLTHALSEEILTTFTGQTRNGIGRNGVNVVGESEFSLDVVLVHLAKADALFEHLGVFGVEQEGKTCHFLFNGLFASRDDFEFPFSPVVANDFNWAPGVLLVDVHGT